MLESFTKRVCISLGLIWLSILNCNSQVDPLTLAKSIFNKEKFENLDNHITGEYNGKPKGTDLPKNAKTYFELLDKTEKTAVVAMAVVDSTGKTLDTYLHFVYEKVWKVTALRALALTGIYEEIIAGYNKMSQAERDSMSAFQKKLAELSGNSFKPKSIDWTFANAKLILSSDKDLIAYFKINKDKFESLKDEALKKGILQSSKRLNDFDESGSLQNQMDLLLLNDISRSVFGSPENVEFIIGGMSDNAVGYMFVKDMKNKPLMAPNGFIMIREIGNGWYLFKTT